MVSGGSGTSVPPEAAEASTTTARLTVTPRCRPRASLIGRRKIRSIASLANSLGAASSAVPSIRPSGRVSRRKARCWGERGGEPAPADAPERSAMTRFHTCPRSPGWSATGRHSLRSSPRTITHPEEGVDHPQTCPHLCARRYADAARQTRTPPVVDRSVADAPESGTLTTTRAGHKAPACAIEPRDGAQTGGDPPSTPRPQRTACGGCLLAPRKRGAGLTPSLTAAYPGSQVVPAHVGRMLSADARRRPRGRAVTEAPPVRTRA